MDQQTLISWNFENWLTIVLMAVLGFLILGTLGQGLRKVIGRGGGDANNVNAGPGSNVLPMSPYMTRQS